MKKLIVLLLPFLLVGCNDVDGELQESSYNYKYRWNENGCDTGEHIFGSMSELCLCLQDEELNNFCARSSRELEFSRLCTGRFNVTVDCRN